MEAGRNIYLRIEAVPDYSPVDPEPKSGPMKRYRRDEMRNPGHENGSISDLEVEARTLGALVYREYLDPQYTVPKPDKLVLADITEPVFDHRVPGAVIYTCPGERLNIHVFNADPDSAHSFHVHGLRYGIDSDGSWPLGVPTVGNTSRSDSIPPGQGWTYNFEVTEDMIGAWPFHDHYQNIGATIARGLFGGIVVLPEEDRDTIPVLTVPAVAQETASFAQTNPTPVPDGDAKTLRSFLSEWAGLSYVHPDPRDARILHVPIFIHRLSPLTASPMPPMAMPGGSGPGLGAASPANEPSMAMSTAPGGEMHAASHPARPLFNHRLEPGGAPFTFVFQIEGTYDYHCTIHSEMKGRVIVQLDGAPSASVRVSEGDPMGFDPPTVTVRPGGSVTWSPGTMPHTVTENGGKIQLESFCLNGRTFAGNTPTIRATPGQRIRWYVFNLDLDTGWHNFHTHGQRWSLGGRAMDVLSIGPAESFVLETEAPPVLLLPPDIEETQDASRRPDGARAYELTGRFLFHCHVEMHMMAGLAGIVQSRQTLWLTDEQKQRLAVDVELLAGNRASGSAAVPKMNAVQAPAVAGATSNLAPAQTPAAIGPPAAGAVEAASDSAAAELATGGAAVLDLVDSALGITAIGSAAGLGDAVGGQGPGRWETVPGDPEKTMMHSILLPNTTKVLFYGYAVDTDGTIDGNISRLWDYESGLYHPPLNQPIDVALGDPAAPGEPPPPDNWDLHSSEHAYLDTPDAQLLIHGGNTSTQAFRFRPGPQLWSRTAPTLEGRYYSTSITLPEGKVLTLYGSHQEGGHEPNKPPQTLAHSMEIYDPDTGAWTKGAPFPAPPAFDYRYYPWTYVLPGGDLFIAGHQGVTRRFDRSAPANNAAKTWNTNAGDRSPNDQQMGTSVLLPLRPPNYEPRVLIAGGDPKNAQHPEKSAEIIDLSVPSPVWTYTKPLHGARVLQVNSVLLPDGRVLISGGMPGASGPGPVEIFDPMRPDDGWVAGAVMPHYRLYHSSAILLPDGSVLMGGDPPDGSTEPATVTPHDRYYPSYFEQSRPSIASADVSVAFGAQFTIQTPNAASIAEVALLHPGATTHGFNMAQRLVYCDIVGRTPGSLQVETPPDGTITPPGFHLLFIVDQNRIPSIGRWIRLHG